MRIHIWRGFHCAQIRALVERTWTLENELLILCPPALASFDFVKYLPEGEIQWFGDWPSPPSNVERVQNHADFPDTPRFGVFTSGTTQGIPKLVLYSRANILASLNGILKFFAKEELDSIFCYPQPFHTFGLLLGYVLSVHENWPLFTGEGKYSSLFHARRLKIQRPGLLTLGTPTHFLDLLSYVRAEQRTPAPSYSCIVGGATVSVQLWRRLRDELNIKNPSVGYGATEASPGVLHLNAGHEPAEDGHIGFPIEGIQIASTGEKGYEFSGPSACLAIVHHDRIEFPEKIFISDKLRPRADGSYIFQGRTDFVLNRGGEKFYLESIENVLREREVKALAFSVPDPRLGQELGLLLQGEVDLASVVNILAEKFMVRFNPENFKSVASFPLNANQKPDRRALEGHP